MKARQHDGSVGPFIGGFAFYPYQISLGISLRYWPRIFMPSARIHIGPFKLWGGISFKGLCAYCGQNQWTPNP